MAALLKGAGPALPSRNGEPLFNMAVTAIFCLQGLTRWLYEKTRLLYLPIYGPFPVKLRTFIGEPILYDPNITAAELAERVNGGGKYHQNQRRFNWICFFHWYTRGTSAQETMSCFTQMLENLISFPYLEEYLSSVAHPGWLFMLPILLCLWIITFYLCAYAVSFLLYVYKMMKNQQESDVSKMWERLRKVIAQGLHIYGKIWHGYEVIGMENLPKGPGIIIYYHAPIALDYSFLVARLYKEAHRECFSIIDHALYRLPGWKMIYELLWVKDFSKAESVEILKKGHLLGIPPGGAREGNFSNDYSIMWGNRTGFAQIALEAKVPIIPIFTQNICEAIRNIGKTRLTRWLYEKTRLLFLPVYGPFPVKLRTFIGEPIPYDPNITAAELVERTKTAIENLRDKHQKRPGNILRAISERFDKHNKAN